MTKTKAKKARNKAILQIIKKSKRYIPLDLLLALRKIKQCEKCFMFNIPLETHHIIPISQGGTNIDHNLIRLCTKCHKQEHH